MEYTMEIKYHGLYLTGKQHKYIQFQFLDCNSEDLRNKRKWKVNYLQIGIPILLRCNSVNLIIPKIPLSYLPPVVIHAQLKSACTNLNKSMTSTTNVTTFIHIILLLHVFSQFHKYVFCHPSSTQVFSLLKSTPQVLRGSKPAPARRRPIPLPHPLAPTHLLHTSTLSKTSTYPPLFLPHTLLSPHCRHSPSPERPLSVVTPESDRASHGRTTGHAWYCRPALTTVIWPLSCPQRAPLALTVWTPRLSSDSESLSLSRISNTTVQTPYPYCFDLPLPWWRY